MEVLVGGRAGGLLSVLVVLAVLESVVLEVVVLLVAGVDDVPVAVVGALRATTGGFLGGILAMMLCYRGGLVNQLLRIPSSLRLIQTLASALSCSARNNKRNSESAVNTTRGRAGPNPCACPARCGKRSRSEGADGEGGSSFRRRSGTIVNR